MKGTHMTHKNKVEVPFEGGIEKDYLKVRIPFAGKTFGQLTYGDARRVRDLARSVSNTWEQIASRRVPEELITVFEVAVSKCEDRPTPKHVREMQEIQRVIEMIPSLNTNAPVPRADPNKLKKR
jgi:hypothetical protein